MTLECRCSNCGSLLQTTNADPLHAEIERLRARYDGAMVEQHRLDGEIERLRDHHARNLGWEKCAREAEAEVYRLRAYALHERSLGADGPMIELMQARQEIEGLRAALDIAVKVQREIQDEKEQLRSALKTIAHWQEHQRISAPIYVMEALATHLIFQNNKGEGEKK